MDTLVIDEADAGTWYRISLCVGKSTTVNKVRPLIANYGNDLVSQGWPDLASSLGQGWSEDYPGVNSLEALNSETRDSFWHDSDTGWVHLKMVISEDRTKGGSFRDRIPGRVGKFRIPENSEN